jgi:hypothetical protein
VTVKFTFQCHVNKSPLLWILNCCKSIGVKKSLQLNARIEHIREVDNKREILPDNLKYVTSQNRIFLYHIMKKVASI